MADFASTYSLANRPTTELQSPLDIYSKVQQVKSGQQQLQMGQMQMEQMQRQMQDEATMRQFARDAQGDVLKTAEIARKNGYVNQAAALEKNFRETQDALMKMDDTQRRRVREFTMDLGKAAMWATGQDGTPDQTKWQQVLKTYAPQMPPNFDITPYQVLTPELRGQLVNNAMTVEQIVNQGEKAYQRDFGERKFAEEARHNKAMENKPNSVLGPAVIPGENRASAAEEYAKRLVQGLETWPSQQTLRTDPVVREGVVLARRMDPTFNSATHAQRAATQKAFTVGKQGDNINALNTAMGHLGELSDYAEKLGNSNMRALNTAKNWLAGQTGDPDIAAFNTTRKAVADEVTRVWRGTGGAESDIQEAMKNLDSSQSPAQLRIAIYQLTKLMHSKQKALEDQYQKGMGGKFGSLETLDEEAKSSLVKIQNRAGIRSSRNQGDDATKGKIPTYPSEENPQGGAKSADDLLKLLGHQ